MGVGSGQGRRGRNDRSLDGSELCVETHFLTETYDRFLEARQKSWLNNNIVLHCVHPGFDPLWRHGNLWDEAMEIRHMADSGAATEAATSAKDLIAPTFTLTGTPDSGRFRTWFGRYLDLGVTMFAVSDRMEELTGVSPVDAKRWPSFRIGM